MSECIVPDWYKRYSDLSYALIDSVDPARLASIKESSGGFAALEHTAQLVEAMPFADTILAERGIVSPRWITSAKSTPDSAPQAILADALVEDHDDHITMRLWSALLTDERLASYLATWSAMRRTTPWSGRSFETSFRATFHIPDEFPGLPHIEIRISTTCAISTDLVVDWYKQGPWKAWQERLWDGRPGLKPGNKPGWDTLVRRWTLYSLQKHANLNLRDSIQVWNELAPEKRLKVGSGTTGTGESVASRERREAEAYADRLLHFLDSPTDLTDSGN